MDRYTYRFWMVMTVACVVLLLSVNAWAGKRIGILLFSDESRYLDAAQGITDALQKSGYAAPATHIQTVKAGGDKAKAVELAQELAREKLDLAFAVGTSSALLMAKEITATPLVFSVVYDPVEIGIAKSWKSSGNNTTGISSKIPVTRLLDALKLLKPIKRLAVLYTAGEKNSESTLHELQNAQAASGIKIIPALFSTREDIGLILPEVLKSVDGIYITGSNVVTSQVETIAIMATTAGVISVTHLQDMVEKGVMMGLCANPYTMGRLAGEKAVKVLRGTKPSSIPIETLSAFDVILNLKTVQAGRFKVPSAFMKIVTKKIE